MVVRRVGCLAPVQHQHWVKRWDARHLSCSREIWLFWACARRHRKGGLAGQRQGRTTVEHEMLQGVAADTKLPPWATEHPAAGLIAASKQPIPPWALIPEKVHLEEEDFMGTVLWRAEKCTGSAVNQTKAAHLRFCKWPDLSLYPPVRTEKGHLTLFSRPRCESLRNTQTQGGHERKMSHFDLVEFHDMSYVWTSGGGTFEDASTSIISWLDSNDSARCGTSHP